MAMRGDGGGRDGEHGSDGDGFSGSDGGWWRSW